MAVIRRLHVPLRAPEDVIPHLGAPHHWKQGRSAKHLIDSWWTANEIPASLKRLLDEAPEWRNAVLIDAFAERCTSLEDSRPSHSQSDLLAIVGVGNGIAVLSIEAKVDEGFDRTVGEWIGDGSKGKALRLARLRALLGIEDRIVSELRYQLLHRTAAAVLEAKRYRTNQAAMIVQSWCPERSSLDDYSAFCRVLGIAVTECNKLTDPISLGDVGLRLGWCAEAD
ncbi:MAG: hypothetical protein K2Y17_05000 [Qipengyuania sp.]|nr:hypothetical protein [Qipengyuania sp.]